jgi:hypothetical protein
MNPNERKNINQIAQAQAEIDRLMKINANTIASKISILQSKRLLQPSKYGSQLVRNSQLLKAISQQFYSFEGNVNKLLNGQTREAWDRANKINDSMIAGMMGKGAVIPIEWTLPNYKALGEFQSRIFNKQNLSERIHNITEQNKQIYRDYIGTGTTQGKSASEIAKDLLQINNDPVNVKVFDKLGEVTKLGLESPLLIPGAVGPGIYKSAYKNLLRVTRNEINAAYRTSDQTRWKQLDFVKGYEVHLSDQHSVRVPKGDECDSLAGIYPKEFKFVNWHVNCYSDDTEIMTHEGWKLFRYLKDTDKVFSLNPVTRVPEYTEIIRQYKRLYQDDMVHFNNAFLSILVTKDHDVSYLNKSNIGQFCKKKAIDFGMGNGSIYRTSEYAGQIIESIQIGVHPVDFNTYSEFMGYYLSDGCITLSRPYHCTISQQINHDLETHAKIKTCLDKMPLKYTIDKMGFHFHDQSFYEYLGQFGKSFNKHIPNDILNSSKEQIRIFLDAFVCCDGIVSKPHAFTGSRGATCLSKEGQKIYFTSSPQMMSDLGECIVKVGHRPGFKNLGGKGKANVFRNGTYIQNHDGWRISECVSKSATVFKKDLVHYDGYVYDIEIEKNHIMYLRRNGFAYWGHNCLCFTTSILATREEMTQYFKTGKFNMNNQVKTLPIGMTDYIRDNEDKAGKANWFTDNLKLIEKKK